MQRALKQYKTAYFVALSYHKIMLYRFLVMKLHYCSILQP